MPTLRPRSTPRGAVRVRGTVVAGCALAAIAASAPHAVRAQADARRACDAIGDTLAAARSAYAVACPPAARLDCAPVVGGWACASYRIDAGVPGAAPDTVPDTLGPPDVPPVVSADGAVGHGECRWIDATLEAARAGYADLCLAERRDCDPIPEGWMCSSRQIGASMPGGRSLAVPGGAVPDPLFVDGPDPMSGPEGGPAAEGGAGGAGSRGVPDAPAFAPEPDDGEPGFGPVGLDGTDGPGGPTPPPAPGEPEPPSSPAASVYDGRYGAPSVSWADSYSAGGTCYAATTGDHGVYDLMVDTPTGRTTVLEALGRIESGPGISRADALYNDIRCGRGPANDAGDEDPDQCPGRVDQGYAGCGTRGPDWKFVR